MNVGVAVLAEGAEPVPYGVGRDEARGGGVVVAGVHVDEPVASPERRAVVLHDGAAQRVGDPEVLRVANERGGHDILNDVTHARVASDIVGFIERHLA